MNSKIARLQEGNKVIIAGGSEADWKRAKIPKPYYLQNIIDNMVTQAYENKETLTISEVISIPGYETSYNLLNSDGEKSTGFYEWELEVV